MSPITVKVNLLLSSAEFSTRKLYRAPELDDSTTLSWVLRVELNRRAQLACLRPWI
jgi:hypothetical protein